MSAVVLKLNGIVAALAAAIGVFAHLVFNNELVVGLLGAVVALALPLNTMLLIILHRRQSKANHYSDVIRQLAAVLAGTKPAVAEAPAEQVAETVKTALLTPRDKVDP